ncbi:MAG: lysophospholipid acyltransferase family protein [Candidatus Marinimicrobia bacterium]|jgi:Kdo2-lipid IVA lauroyltransferase/acyltransferase|nr:lysophospholipid acyltransferase family protein [Candidatus Neomarinimicrobiota bacterium]MBT4068642.1 lysophospholipid acyltransferase family protein [Candidatus Neomarinimicrobiota bacterium]MBT5176350.1 lysophospholipid acyltransferase family protein [Candidatus Neomarinimicrobiota bacterium]
MTLKDKFTYRLLHVISRRMRRLPNLTRSRLANQLGAFAFNRIPVRKEQAFQNIKLAFPDKSDSWINNVLKGTYRLVSSNFMEFLALPRSYESLNFRVENQHIIDEASKKGKGVIIITGHFGLWEILGSWLGKNGYPVWGIIQRQGNRGADIFFQELRESYGMKHLYRKSSLDNMYKLLKENNMLILASDQDAKKRGVFVKFFGQSSSTPKGSAIFHMRSGAPMVFSVAHREKDGTIVVSFSKIELNGSTSIETITQTYTNLLEEKVREFPDHYFWFHRKWKTKAKA